MESKLKFVVLFVMFGTVTGSKQASVSFEKILPVGSPEFKLYEIYPHEMSSLNAGLKLCAMLSKQSQDLKEKDSFKKTAFHVDSDNCNFGYIDTPLLKAIQQSSGNGSDIGDNDADAIFYMPTCEEGTTIGSITSFHVDLLDDEQLFAMRFYGNGGVAKVDPEINGTITYDTTLAVPAASVSHLGGIFGARFDNGFLKYILEQPLTFPTNELSIVMDYYQEDIVRTGPEGFILMKDSESDFETSGIALEMSHPNKKGSFIFRQKTYLSTFSTTMGYGFWRSNVLAYQAPDTVRLYTRNGGFASSITQPIGTLWPVDEIHIGKGQDYGTTFTLAHVTIIEARLSDAGTEVTWEKFQENRPNFKVSKYCKNT